MVKVFISSVISGLEEHRAAAREGAESLRHLFGPESADSPPVILARAALVFDAANQADDITVRFRRQAKH